MAREKDQVVEDGTSTLYTRSLILIPWNVTYVYINKQRESGVRRGSASPRPVATIESHGPPSVAFRSSAKRMGLEAVVTAASGWAFSFPTRVTVSVERLGPFARGLRRRCFWTGALDRGFEKGLRTGGHHAIGEQIAPILLFWCP